MNGRIFFVAVSFALAFVANTSKSEEALSMNHLNFMTGCWASVEGDTKYEERFTQPTANMMIGISQFVKAGSTEFYELFPIIQQAGKIAYIPYINGVKSIDFTLISAKATEAVFVNQEHDFPQKIIYSKPSENELVARIEGQQNGQQRSEEFRMKRSNCNP